MPLVVAVTAGCIRWFVTVGCHGWFALLVISDGFFRCLLPSVARYLQLVTLVAPSDIWNTLDRHRWLLVAAVVCYRWLFPLTVTVSCYHWFSWSGAARSCCSSTVSVPCCCWCSLSHIFFSCCLCAPFVRVFYFHDTRCLVICCYYFNTTILLRSFIATFDFGTIDTTATTVSRSHSSDRTSSCGVSKTLGGFGAADVSVLELLQLRDGQFRRNSSLQAECDAWF